MKHFGHSNIFISKLRLVYFHCSFFCVRVAKIFKGKTSLFLLLVTHGVILCLLFTIFNKFLKIPNHFPKLNFTYFKSFLNLVFSFLIIRNFEQRHTLKIIVTFRLPFKVPRESHNFFNPLEYSDLSNLY